MNRSRYGARPRASTGSPSSVNSMMSSTSMRSGARARDNRNLFGSSGCLALICPKESTTPSCARMRLAVTISSLSRSSLDIAVPLQNEAYRAERAELVRINENTALLDTKSVADLPQDMAITPHIFTNALITAKTIADKVCRHDHEIIVE